uniref:Uncharacterized protein n=1 Tax=Alexandrium catenella TaxID=2925 RepID=A0A7S1Q950_ALECA
MLALKVSSLLLLATPCAAAPALDIVATFGAEDASSDLKASLRGSTVPGWLPYLPGLPAYIFRWGALFAELDAKMRVGVNLSDTDPLWKNASEIIRHAAYESTPGKKFMDLCSAGNITEYVKESCSTDTLGAIPVGTTGIPVDAFFCGSTHSGINWTRPFWGPYSPPVKPVCEAKADTAYTPTGICGRWTTKQLVLSFFLTTPLWTVDPVVINAPAVHCLLGLGDCDIQYCQHCPGRCGPSQTEILP